MDAGQFDVFHDRRHKGVLAVGDGVRFTFQRVVQEPVNKDGTVRGYADSRRHVVFHLLVVVDHFHAPAAQYKGRAHHDRIADAVGQFNGLFHRAGHTGFRHGNTQFVHDFAELIPVFRQVDDFRRGAQNVHALFFQFGRQVQRSLPAELGDDAYRFFLIVNAQHVFQRQGFKVQFVGSIVVGGYGFRVAVDDDGLKAQLLQGHGRMDAAVVELNTLADAVGAAPQDHDLLFIGYRVVVRRVIGGIEIRTVLGAAHMDAVPGFHHADLFSCVTDIVFGYVQDLAEVFVGKAVLFGLGQGFRGRHRAFVLHQGFLFLHQFFHLLHKVMLHPGDVEDFIYRSAFAQGFVHLEVTFGGRRAQQVQQFFFAEFIKILHMSQTVTSLFQRTDGFLERFLIIFADAHDFAHGAHLGAQFVIHALELFKGPAGEFYDNVISVGHVLVQGAVLAAGQVF